MPATHLVVGIELSAAGLARIEEAAPGLTVTIATDDAFGPALATADAAMHWIITEEELAAAPNLRWFQGVASGVEHLPLARFVERGIVLTNSSGMHAENISEYLLAVMLAFARNIPFLVRAHDRAAWEDDRGRDGLFELNGQTLLILGAGAIGRATGRKAAALGMHVVGVARNPGPLPEGFSEILPLDQVDRVLPDTDHLAITLPHTPATEGLVDAAFLARLKRGAHLYNIGRGPIVVNDALIAALNSGHLAGAALDVTDPEPLPVDSPLWKMQNVLITAHTSGGSPRFEPRLLDIVAENMRRDRAGEPLINVVDPRIGY